MGEPQYLGCLWQGARIRHSLAEDSKEKGHAGAVSKEGNARRQVQEEVSGGHTVLFVCRVSASGHGGTIRAGAIAALATRFAIRFSHLETFKEVCLKRSPSRIVSSYYQSRLK